MIYFSTTLVIVVIHIAIVYHAKTNSFLLQSRPVGFEQRRQQREIRLFLRITLLIVVLFIMGIPYCIFFGVSAVEHFKPPPGYADRICCMCISIGYSLTTVFGLIFTDDVRKIYLTMIRREPIKFLRPKIQCITQLPGNETITAL